MEKKFLPSCYGCSAKGKYFERVLSLDLINGDPLNDTKIHFYGVL